MTNATTDTAESAAAATDPAPPEIEDEADAPVQDEVLAEDPSDVNDEAPSDAKSPRRQRSISVGVRSLVIGAVIAIMAAAIATLGWLYIDAKRQLDAQASQSANDARAEKIALDYAVNAAVMNYEDLQAWKVKLVAGTSPELNQKLTEAAKSMEQIVVPLQWTSTAEPLVAKVRSNSAGIFVVDCFVSVQTKTVQGPEALQSTATYSVTIDSNHDWQITDVGGVGAVVGPR
jgi:hypothetical protein